MRTTTVLLAVACGRKHICKGLTGRHETLLVELRLAPLEEGSDALLVGIGGSRLDL